MATYTVDTTADVVDAGDGVLSLREALAQADATEEADTILFSDSVQGRTIVLAGSQLTVASEVTIDGGSGVTIDADGRSRVLLVEEFASYQRVAISLSHLTITGGRTRGEQGGGAGIYSVPSYNGLYLDHVTVTGNHASGTGGGVDGFYEIYAGYTTVAGNSATGIGGGMVAYDSVVLRNSTVSGNEVRGEGSSGGGIFAGGHLFLENSTVSDNSAIGAGASGGGASVSSVGYVHLTGSTVSGNRAEGANATGGGIDASYGDLYVRNSIVAGNGTTGTGADDVYGFVLSNGCNIFGSEVAGSLPSDSQNVAAATLFAAIDPRTGGGLLADNGGPTWTIALRDAADNPALGRADPAAPYASPTDQRGVARLLPDGTNPDIGAFELDQSDPRPPGVGTTFVVTSTGDTIADDGALTLREALALADADSLTADRIAFASDLQNQTIVLSGGQLEVNSDVTIDGAGVTIDAHGASRVLLVQALDTDAILRHLTLTGGRTAGDYADGGGILAYATTRLTLDHVTVTDNVSAAGSGGGISGYEMTLIECTVTGNRAALQGGGIDGSFNYDVTLINSTVSHNNAVGSGGGIHGRLVMLTNSTVNDNTTTGDQAAGGGIHGGAVTLLNCTVSGNKTLGNGSNLESGDSAGGGGVYAFDATITNSTISGNSTAGLNAAGGGIGLHHGSAALSISNSIVAGNAAAASPGADVSGTIGASNGHNIFGSDVEGNAAGDLENVPAGLLFAGGLADHGGPTQTIALRDAADNPALGGADPAAAPAADQRGVTRPLPGGTNPDIGAFEHAALPLDGLQYIASYADLIRALGPDEAAGEAHYRAYGAAEGRQVPFDGLEYVASYVDLIAQLGADRDAGSVHFISHGLDEGRGTSFDGLEYVASHADLIAALGADRAAGSRHFIDHGAAEGRQTSFDGLQYIASHEDLITALGANADAGAVHFIRFGASEERAPDDFDAEQYLANYADLQAAFGADTDAATAHYIRYGHGEGRRDEPLPQAAADFLM